MVRTPHRRTPVDHLARVVPVLDWGRRYDRGDLRSDLLAGLTVGAMLVPQGMAYALLAGLPPEIGLYAAIVPVLVYAVLGTSRQLAVGPVAIVSLLTASALGELAEEGSADYLVAASTLAVLVGGIHLLIGGLRLGFLVNFLSHAVLVGFTAGAAVIIGFSQLKHLLGISTERTERFDETVREYATGLGDTHGLTLAVGVLAVGLLLVMKRRLPTLPAALIVVAVTTAMSVIFDLGDRGVAVVGDIPGDLPSLSFPDLGGGLVGDLLPTALVITVVGFLESIAIAKVYARRNRYRIEANQELVALGAANVAGGAFGAYPVTGGFSRTAVNASAGARTPLASIVTALLVLATVVLLTPAFTELPKATLGAVVVVAVAGLVDVAELRHMAAVDRADLLVAVVSFGATLAIGIELGIGVAIAFSVLVLLYRQARPHTAVLGRLPGTDVFRNIDRFPEVETSPSAVVLRVDSSLNFMNSTFLRPRVDRLLRDHAAARIVVLDCSGVNRLDASAEQALTELLEELDGRSIELHLTNLKGPVRDALIGGGLWRRLGDRLHATNAEALARLDVEERPDEPRPTSIDRRPTGVDERG
ncbi:MAG: sulfate permease [Actinomycetota bacterium]